MARSDTVFLSFLTRPGRGLNQALARWVVSLLPPTLHACRGPVNRAELHASAVEILSCLEFTSLRRFERKFTADERRRLTIERRHFPVRFQGNHDSFIPSQILTQGHQYPGAKAASR
jgi:hypothetical protein